jgi:hypothetical protein
MFVLEMETPPILLDAAVSVPMKLLERVVAELLMLPPLISNVNPVCLFRM